MTQPRDPFTPMKDNFSFSPALMREAQERLRAEVDALEHRISSIVDIVTFDHPRFGRVRILEHVLDLNPSAEELKLLAKCIERVADLAPQLAQLESRLDVVDTIFDDPFWFTASFADVTTELDKFEQQFGTAE